MEVLRRKIVNHKMGEAKEKVNLLFGSQAVKRGKSINY